MLKQDSRIVLSVTTLFKHSRSSVDRGSDFSKSEEKELEMSKTQDELNISKKLLSSGGLSFAIA